MKFNELLTVGQTVAIQVDTRSGKPYKFDTVARLLPTQIVMESGMRYLMRGGSQVGYSKSDWHYGSCIACMWVTGARLMTIDEANEANAKWEEKNEKRRKIRFLNEFDFSTLEPDVFNDVYNLVNRGGL